MAGHIFRFLTDGVVQPKCETKQNWETYKSNGTKIHERQNITDRAPFLAHGSCFQMESVIRMGWGHAKTKTNEITLLLRPTASLHFSLGTLDISPFHIDSPLFGRYHSLY